MARQRLGRLDRARLAQIAALFWSPVEGEQQAALHAFRRLLDAAGATPHDALGVTEDEAPPPTAAPAETQDTGEAGHVPDHHRLVRELAIAGRGVLTRWEADFLTGLLGFRSLSPKQLDRLAEIRAKVEAVEALREAVA